MQVHMLRCFGALPGDGNPALVIENGDPDSAARQAFARERDTTCVWIDPAPDAGSPLIDFYYPHARSPLCVHATLAVAHLLISRAGTAELTVRTAMRRQELGLLRLDDAVFVRLAPQAVAQPRMAPGQVAHMLRIPEDAIVTAPRVTSIGSPKMLVEVSDAATLRQLAPDLAAILAWSETSGVNGIYAYCRRADGSVEGRNFNHRDARLEDSATGVAAGALTVLLGQDLALYQGHESGRNCLIRTRLHNDAVLVGGRVESCGNHDAEKLKE